MDETLTPPPTPRTEMEETLTGNPDPDQEEKEEKEEVLPPELMQEIILRLPSKSLFESRCVRRAWLNLVKDPRFANMHLSRNQNPGLIFQSIKENKMYFIPDCEISCDLVTIQLYNSPFKSWVHPLEIMGSCNGFCCLAYTSHYFPDIFICNPLIGEYTKLPYNATFTFGCNSVGLGFGFDPQHMEYKVVSLIFDSSTTTLKIMVHTLGTDSWRSIRDLWRISTDRGIGHIEREGVFVDGKLYWWGVDITFRGWSIISVNLRDEIARLIPPPSSAFGLNGKVRHMHLGSMGEYLSLVDNSSSKHVEVWVRNKDDGELEDWTKLFNINRPIMHDSIDRLIQILTVQKDGKIIVQCGNTTMFSYDPQTERLKDLRISFPIFYKAFSHVSSLASFKDAFVPEKRCCARDDEGMKTERKGKGNIFERMANPWIIVSFIVE